MSNAPSGKSRGGVVKRHTTLPRKPLDSLPGELAWTHVALLPPPHGRAGSGGERLTARVLWHRYCCTRALARDRRVVTMRRRGVRPRSDGGLRRDAVRARRTTNRAPAAQRLTLGAERKEVSHEREPYRQGSAARRRDGAPSQRLHRPHQGGPGGRAGTADASQRDHGLALLRE